MAASGNQPRTRRVRRPFGVLTTAPWWRAPFLLLRRPGVAAALLAASAVATLPAAAAMPFLSASRSATLHHQIDATCSWHVGVTVSSDLGYPSGGLNPFDYNPDYDDALDRRTRRIEAAATSMPQLGPGETTLISPLMHGPTERDLTYPLFFVYRQHAAEHLDLVDGSWSPGAWLPDVYADYIGLAVGDTMPLQQPTQFQFDPEPPAEHSVPVTAIYRSLREQPDPPWWCDLVSTYNLPAGNNPAPETIFVDRQTFLDTVGQYNIATTTHRIAFPLADPSLDMDRARATVEQLDASHQALLRPTDDDRFSLDNRQGITSRLPTFVNRADLTRESLLHTVLPITAAGVLVGIVVVAAAAAYWVQRRRQELTMLAAHGVGARALGMKAIL